MLIYPVSCGGVYGLGCNLKIVTIPPTREQGHHTYTHTHTHTHTRILQGIICKLYAITHTHTHTHMLLQGIIGKIIVLNLRAEVTINNLIFFIKHLII